MMYLNRLRGSGVRSREMLRSLSRVVPPAAIEQALERTGARQRRVRELPPALVVQLVIVGRYLPDLAAATPRDFPPL